MKLEVLPNEILLDLFDYFNGTDLLRAFCGLNSRFNLLLNEQFRSYRFRLDSVSKRDFDLICQQHLPFITDRVIALTFCDYDETPGQINLFCSYIPSFRQFTRLRSLTISELRSYETLLKLLDECHHLNSLTHLKLFSCSFSNSDTNFQLIINTIWSLPRLTNCYLSVDIEEQQSFCIPTSISLSLECVTIFRTKFKMNQINRLFDYTPRLKHLAAFIEFVIDNDYITSPHSTLIQFHIHFSSPFDISQMTVFLQSTPHLRHLSIETLYELIDGHYWEQIIRNYLPKLKIFRLSMKKLLPFEQNLQQKADELINSFRSSFWIVEHQWFVRCVKKNSTICLYTLSSGSASYCDGNMFPDWWKSTYPQDNQQEFYKSITGIYDETFFNQPISSDIRLCNIKYLHITFPINDQFWSIVPNLNQLMTLSILSLADIFQSQLQTLLDRAPRVVLLTIEQDASVPLPMSLFRCTNASVRLLHLQDCNHRFTEDECITLSRSPLGAQCEILYIFINNRGSVINLTKNMLHLRILIVKCTDDEYPTGSTLTEDNDGLVQWLKDHLPSTYLIVRDPTVSSDILIWM